MTSQTRAGTVAINGFALRFVRQTRNISVVDLAAKMPSGRKDKVGCDRSYLTHIENGTKKHVSVEFYNALLSELAVEDYKVLLADPHTFAGQVPA